MKSLQPAMIVALVLGSACTDGMDLASDAGPSDRGAAPDSPEEAAEASTDGGTGEVSSRETGGPCPPTVTHGGSCSGEPECVMPEPGCSPCEAGHYLLLNEYCICRTSAAFPAYWVCRPPDADCPYGDSSAYCDPDCTRPFGTCADGGTDGGDAGDPDASDGDLLTCAGGWFDPTSGLCWQDPPDGRPRRWSDAEAYCEGLALGGLEDWRLPAIGELRSLVRECPVTETGGACGVTDACRVLACDSGACLGCSYESGPGAEGAYWPPELHGGVAWLWSSSLVADEPSMAWSVIFHNGQVYPFEVWQTPYVRCVRGGP